jgi:hypothetical protein
VPDISGRAIANLEIESLKHANPTFHGDTIYSETEVLEKRESRSKPDRGIVKVRTIGYKQDGTIVCEFTRKVLVPKRATSSTASPAVPSPPSRADRDRRTAGGGGARVAGRATTPPLAGRAGPARR